MSSTDQLARLIFDLAVPQPPCPDCMGKPTNGGAEKSRAAADEIIRRGWRPPPRVIETVEQLQALPEWTMVRWVSPSGLSNGVIERFDGSWWQPGNDARLDPERIPLPATVLWSPEEVGSDGE